MVSICKIIGIYPITIRKSNGTRWDFELADFDVKLHIDPVVEKQEIPSDMEKLSKYEGFATVIGTYEGQEVTGRATIEIIRI
ncbi:TPA: hypothetical protein ACPQXP_000253 [Streptococcus mutans]